MISFRVQSPSAVARHLGSSRDVHSIFYSSLMNRTVVAGVNEADGLFG